MSGAIAMGTSKITGLGDPTLAQDAATKAYVDLVGGSAAAAAASAASAEASYDAFDDRYLGAKASAPTVDNDGDPLVAGALYYNSTDGVMKVYDGGTWIAASAASQVTTASARVLKSPRSNPSRLCST